MILNYSPIFSIILSLMIVNGFYNLAYKASFLTRNLIIKDVLFATIINFCVIVNLFAFLTFFTLLYFKINIEIYKLSSILIILFGFYKPAYLKFFKFILLKKTIKLNLIYLILFFYFLLSLSPISDPDSLDYHITVPLYILNFYDHPFHKYCHQSIIRFWRNISIIWFKFRCNKLFTNSSIHLFIFDNNFHFKL